MIKENLENAIREKISLSDCNRAPYAPEPILNGIPTLGKGVYKKLSPMLKDRFEKYGRWEQATHGSWLSITDMETLWKDKIDDEFLSRIKSAIQVAASGEGWTDHACALFKDNRISAFAASDNGYESIILLWLDSEEEPEFWVYDSNGESRYKNLDVYLTAYINDDLSASENSWRA